MLNLFGQIKVRELSKLILALLSFGFNNSVSSMIT